jgi:hypothetical protein
MKEEYRNRMTYVLQEMILHLKKCNYCRTILLEVESLYPKRGCYCDFDCFRRYRQRKNREYFLLNQCLED